MAGHSLHNAGFVKGVSLFDLLSWDHSVWQVPRSNFSWQAILFFWVETVILRGIHLELLFEITKRSLKSLCATLLRSSRMWGKKTFYRDPLAEGISKETL